MNKKLTKKQGKKFLAFLLPLLAVGLVTAGVLSYYALVTITLDVNQPISIDGDLTQDIDCNTGDTCLGSAFTISNSGEEDKTITLSDNSGDNIDVSYVGKMSFMHKDLQIGDSYGDIEEIVYSVTGDTFIATGIPTGYSLIYYPDMDGGFTENVANILVYGIDTFLSLPVLEDIGDDYCNILTLDGLTKANPDAKVCNGAKLWLVEEGYVVALQGGSWTPSKILFETDLITYTNSIDGEVLVPAKSTITIYPQFEVDKYTSSGERTINIEIA